MGILIKDMEMPTEYGRCVTIYPDGRVTTEFGAVVIAHAESVPDADLSTPHGIGKEQC